MTQDDIALMLAGQIPENNGTRQSYRLIKKITEDQGGKSTGVRYEYLPANEFVPYGEHGRMVCIVRGDVRRMPSYNTPLVAYLVDYKRQLALRAYTRDNAPGLLDAIDKIVERRAAEGARAMIGGCPGGW